MGQTLDEEGMYRLAACLNVPIAEAHEVMANTKCTGEQLLSFVSLTGVVPTDQEQEAISHFQPWEVSMVMDLRPKGITYEDLKQARKAMEGVGKPIGLPLPKIPIPTEVKVIRIGDYERLPDISILNYLMFGRWEI